MYIKLTRLLAAISLTAVWLVPSAVGQEYPGNPGAPGVSSFIGEAPQRSFYPQWGNQLDAMQQQGGYYAVTGSYPNAAPVTSFYPASSFAPPPAGTPSQPSQMYDNSVPDYQGAYPQQVPQAPAGYPQPGTAYQQPQYKETDRLF